MMTQTTNADKAEIFARHALPGMTLTRRPAPLIRRCTCGKPVSDSKFWCLRCRDLMIEQIAQGNSTREELRAVLAQSTPDERAQIARRLVAAAKAQSSPTSTDTVAEAAD